MYTIILRQNDPKIKHHRHQICLMKSSLNESTINLVGVLFLLEPIHPWWMSLHKCHKSWNHLPLLCSRFKILIGLFATLCKAPQQITLCTDRAYCILSTNFSWLANVLVVHTDKLNKVHGCHSVWFSKFSNFYRLDSHNKACVALANILWNINKNWMEI